MERKDLAMELALHLSRFKRDESGVATIFACFMIMMMVLVGGIGVDLMRAEMERTRLQNTLDRAVLAAADMQQTLDPKSVVIDYFEKSGIEDLIGTSNITVTEGLNYRTVTAGATTLEKTGFMHLMGVETLKVPARGAAEERISNVEISLVLDVSGSMEWNGKMANLQTAAKEFIDAVLRPETQNLVSISIVPYSEHVNVGDRIYSELNTSDYFWYDSAGLRQIVASRCVEIPDSEFSSVELDLSMTYQQAQHYQWNWNGYSNHIDDTVCPKEDFESITAFNQNATDLKDQIDDFEPRAGTSIFLGVKWGAALLDPSTRPIATSMISSGDVDAPFAGRPAAYSDPITAKHLLVMTDGKNDRSNRIHDWAYNSKSEYAHWSNYNFWYFMDSFVHWSYHDYYWYQKYTAAQGDTLTDSICTEAKNAGIIVWGVAFETDDHGANTLKDCASSESHFFRVENTQISEAFQAIASQINQLRLTQ